MDFHELLEIALYCCMEAALAEAASVLLLDDEKENLTFYQIEGPAKPVLAAATFPADQGLAGSVLQFVSRYRGDLARDLDAGRRPRVRFLPYDWSLNDQARKAG